MYPQQRKILEIVKWLKRADNHTFNVAYQLLKSLMG